MSATCVLLIKMEETIITITRACMTAFASWNMHIPDVSSYVHIYTSMFKK